MCGTCGCQEEKLVQIEKDILAENQNYADKNRQILTAQHILCYNLVSSPGSGKTTLLVNTIDALNQDFIFSVIEGDQQTDIDAKRIKAVTDKVLQINTGKTCHLDAHHIEHALESLKPEKNSFLFIENVGNLVCPALFDLGEKEKIVIMSVTEGDDKPIKYPYMFEHAALMLINKIDLLPYVNFEVERCIDYARRINPAIEVVQCSATSKEGLASWIEWLQQQAKQFIA